MDDGSRSWLILVFFLLIAAFLSAVTETAYASVSRSKLKTRAEKGDTRARTALDITDHIDRAITTILICTNIIHLAAASVVTVHVTRRYGASAVTVSTLVTTLVVFFFGEMLPKSIARKYSERICLETSGILHFLMKVLGPASAFLTWIGNSAAKHTKGDPEATVTEDELFDIIEDMTEEGTLAEEQGDLISSALQFGDVTVESILTSRVDVAAVEIGTDADKVITLIKNLNHSRIPVFEGTIDNVVGVLQIRKYIKEYLKAREAGEVPDMRSLLDEPCFVHQSTKIDDLLTLMSKRKLNMAIVTDNYGGTLGIVTVEDILEELVGEIWDEDDKVINNIVQIQGGAYSVNAEEHVTDVLDELDIDYDEEEKERLGDKLMSELAYENFAEIPREGDHFRYLNTEITVLSMKKSRIYRLKVEILPAEPEEGKNKV